MIGEYIRVGVGILRSIIADTGAILVQTGDAGTDETEADRTVWWQTIGLISKPSKAEPGKRSAEGIVARGTREDHVIASRDLRGLELAGLMKDGETTLYAAGENGTAQARVALKGDGSVSLYTTSDNTKDGQSVYFRVAPDGFMFVAPWGTLRFDESGFHVTTHSGATFNMGGIGGLPAPLDQIGSYISGQAATTSFVSSAQTLGAGPVQPVALTPAVLLAIDALQAQCAAMATAWAALGALTGPVAGAMIQPIAAPLVTVAAAGVTAVAASHVAMPATTSSA